MHGGGVVGVAADPAQPREVLEGGHDTRRPVAARRRQHGDEAVQLAVEADLAKHFAAIALHAAVVVVQLAAGQGADHPVEDPAGADLVPGVVPRLLPAADDVAFTNTGEGKRPYSPVNVEGSWDGSNNLTVTFDSVSGDDRCPSQVECVASGVPAAGAATEVENVRSTL